MSKTGSGFDAVTPRMRATYSSPGRSHTDIKSRGQEAKWKAQSQPLRQVMSDTKEKQMIGSMQCMPEIVSGNIFACWLGQHISMLFEWPFSTAPVLVLVSGQCPG